MTFLLAVDQGTTSTRAVLTDHLGNVLSQASQSFESYFPKPGWVEQNPEDLWQTTLTCCQEVIARSKVSPQKIAALGISNQRETTLLWDKATGEPLYNAIVWQDRRTQAQCAEWNAQGQQPWIRAKTGLLIDPYFSASKLAWLLNTIPGARQRAEKGELAFGTVECFLVWRLTRGKRHITDVTNASRTLLFNLAELTWDEELLAFFQIPAVILPEVVANTGELAKIDPTFFQAAIPLCALAGDQQAASIGQACFKIGETKSTYGTGCFVLTNSSEQVPTPPPNILATVQYQIKGSLAYALEGSIFMAGALIEWLRDSLQLITTPEETERLAKACDDTHGATFIPAFTGLGAPYWQADVSGMIVGLTRGVTKKHIVRAALESIGYQTQDLLGELASRHAIPQLRVDGGMASNQWLMQFLSDLCQIPVAVSSNQEATVHGIINLLRLHLGYVDSLQTLSTEWQAKITFEPKESVKEKYLAWQQTISRYYACQS